MLKSAGIYTAANMLNAAVPFLLLPILTRYLTPAEYAIVTLFQVMMNGVLPFVGFNLEGAINRQFFDRSESSFPAYVSNGFYILISSSLVMLLLFELTASGLETLTQFPSNWMWAIVCFAFCQKIAEILLTIWRVEDKPIHFGVFRVLRTSLDLGLSMYFIIVLKRSWEGRIEGQLVAIAFFAIIAVYYLAKGRFFKWEYHKEYIRGILKFGLPLIPHVLGAVIITYSDRLFITNMIGLKEMGLYSVGYQIGMVISLLQNSFNQAWQPWLYQKLKDGDFSEKIKIVKMTYVYFIGLILAVLALTIIGPWIVEYMTADEYQDANQFIFWIALGFAFNGMYKMVGNYLFYLRKTMTIGVITGATALINIGLNYIFIKMNGSVGAAQSTAVTFFIQFIIVWFISAKYFKMPWLTFNQKNGL